jgi:hypothetical protein
MFSELDRAFMQEAIELAKEAEMMKCLLEL